MYVLILMSVAEPADQFSSLLRRRSAISGYLACQQINARNSNESYRMETVELFGWAGMGTNERGDWW